MTSAVSYEKYWGKFQETEFVSSISSANMQITSTANEQAAVSEEVNSNVASIRDLINSLQGISQNSDIASQALTKLAEKLTGMTEKFKLKFISEEQGTSILNSL